MRPQKQEGKPMNKNRIRFPALSLFLLLSVFTIGAQAQQVFHIGDAVEVQDGSNWIPGRIESVDNNIAKVRIGKGKYDFINVQLPTTRFRVPGSAANEARDIQRQNAFFNEAGKYLPTLRKFAPFYDANYISGGAPNTPAEWQTAMSELAELDTLCKTKYPGMTNATYGLREGLIDYRFAVWCEIAARRSELEKPARISAAKNQITLVVTEDNLTFAFNHQKNRVPDETQLLMYEREKWRQLQVPKYKPRFAEYGIEMPADFFAGVEKKADELQKLIEQTAPNRSWEPRPFHDPAVEAFIRGKYASDPDYRGVRVLTIGLDYKIWTERKGLSYLGSDSNFRYYKVEYNYYKRGWALVKLPNRPYCQAQEWIVGRGATGMVLVSLGGSGIFMKCQ
jgi:hypothetical protein